MQETSDARAPLCTALEEYLVRCIEERRSVARELLDFVRSTPDCFERSHAAGHITGSAWVLSPDGKKALLLLHRNLRRWLQPGGHADGDADVLRVACREATEETGIAGLHPVQPGIFDVDIHVIPESPRAPEHKHYDVRFLLRAPTLSFTISDESLDIGWFTLAEMLALDPQPDESVLRLARILPYRNSLTSHKDH